MAMKSPQKDLLIDASHVSKQSVLAKISSRSINNHHICYDLAKRLSHYLYLLYFTFLLDLLHREECGKVSHHRCHSYMVISHNKSHDECGKVVHRLCSSCISSV